MSGYAFEQVAGTGRHGNCQICGFDADRETVLMVRYRAGTLYLCDQHAGELAAWLAWIDFRQPLRFSPPASEDGGTAG